MSQIAQGNMSVTLYYTKFKTRIDELDCISAKPKCSCSTCTCAVNAKLEVYDQSMHLI